jgi:hypothetical protein
MSALLGEEYGMVTDEWTLRFAAMAARRVYDMPDLRRWKDSSEFYQDALAFMEPVPGYKLCGARVEHKTGLKVAVMIPEPADPARPAIVAFQGSQTTQDWITNLGFGEAKALEFDHFLERTFPVTRAKASGKNAGIPACGDLQSRPILITGHSLGGALAQYVAFRLQERRQALGIDEPVQVVTFNGLGGAPLVNSYLARHRDVGLRARGIAAAQKSLFLRACGDVVSLIAEPVTENLRTLPCDGQPEWGRLALSGELSRIIDAHSMERFLGPEARSPGELSRQVARVRGDLPAAVLVQGNSLWMLEMKLTSGALNYAYQALQSTDNLGREKRVIEHLGAVKEFTRHETEDSARKLQNSVRAQADGVAVVRKLSEQDLTPSGQRLLTEGGLRRKPRANPRAPTPAEQRELDTLRVILDAQTF